MPIRLATIGLSALLAVSLSAHAQEKSYSPPQRPFLEDFTAPADVSRGTVSEIFVGPEAHERTGAPQSVCPPDGNPDAEAFAAWFTGWSLQGMGGYAMANNPASFKPAHQATVPAGEGAQFPVGSSDPEGPFPSIVKRVALCAHAAPSDIGDEEVFVHLTRIGLTPAACPGEPGFATASPSRQAPPTCW